MPQKGRKTTSIARRGVIIEEGYAPMHGEPTYDTNKAAPDSMGGSARNLAHSISGGAKVPKEPNGSKGGTGVYN